MNDKRTISTRYKYAFNLSFALVGGIFLVALPSLFPGQYSGFWREFVPKIGEAVIIATFIARFVDDPTKRKLIEEFASDISTHMVGRLLPPLLREHIHEYLGVDFVRYNWQITYRIEPVEGKAGYVCLQTISSYEVQNCSPFEKKYVPAFEVEESWSPDIGATQIVLVRAHDQKSGQDLFNLRRNDPRLKTKTEDGYVKLDLPEAMEIKMPGCDNHSQHRFLFELQSVEYFRDSFYTPFDALHPVLPNTTLTVLFPRSQLKVGLYLTFSDLADAATGPEELPDGLTWTITKPILPGQGFIVRWNPLAANAALSASTTAR